MLQHLVGRLNSAESLDGAHARRDCTLFVGKESSEFGRSGRKSVALIVAIIPLINLPSPAPFPKKLGKILLQVITTSTKPIRIQPLLFRTFNNINILLMSIG
jgi:hypothetical protein